MGVMEQLWPIEKYVCMAERE